MIDGHPTPRISAVELAVDLHAIRVIATHNYQQCITAIWRGYYTIQYHDDGRLSFRPYERLHSQRFIDHFDPERMKGVFLWLCINSQFHCTKTSTICFLHYYLLFSIQLLSTTLIRLLASAFPKGFYTHLLSDFFLME